MATPQNGALLMITAHQQVLSQARGIGIPLWTSRHVRSQSMSGVCRKRGEEERRRGVVVLTVLN